MSEKKIKNFVVIGILIGIAIVVLYGFFLGRSYGPYKATAIVSAGDLADAGTVGDSGASTKEIDCCREVLEMCEESGYDLQTAYSVCIDEEMEWR